VASKSKVVVRKCLVCGRKLKITLLKNNKYSGGQYFGKLDFDDLKGVEYWECEKCFNED